MNSHTSPERAPESASPDDILSARFANMVIQQSNMAFMLLGKVPHPETGEVMRDLDSAQMVIDQLEMIETKTKGNLTKDEDSLLKQSLMALRLAFVEAVEAKPEDHAASSHAASSGATDPSRPGPQSPSSGAPSSSSQTPSGAEEESRKKFSKKY